MSGQNLIPLIRINSTPLSRTHLHYAVLEMRHLLLEKQQKTEVPLNQWVQNNHLSGKASFLIDPKPNWPLYDSLVELLEALEYDMDKLEADLKPRVQRLLRSQALSVQTESVVEPAPTVQGRGVTALNRAALPPIGPRLTEALKLAGLTSREITKVHHLNQPLHPYPNLLTALRVKHATRVSLAFLLRDTPLSERIVHGQYRSEAISPEEVARSQELIRHYIVRRMKDLNMTIAQLSSIDEQLSYDLLQRLLIRRSINFSYITLAKIATRLHTTASELVFPLESDLLRFDEIDFNIRPPQGQRGSPLPPAHILRDVNTLSERLLLAISLDSSPWKEIQRLTGWTPTKLRNLREMRPRLQVQTLLGVSWVTGINPYLFLTKRRIEEIIENKLAYNPTRAHPLSDDTKRRIMYEVVRNIQFEIERKYGAPLLEKQVQELHKKWGRFTLPVAPFLELAEELEITPDRFFRRIFTPQRLVISPRSTTS